MADFMSVSVRMFIIFLHQLVILVSVDVYIQYYYLLEHIGYKEISVQVFLGW
jgi:hypothetical protein